MPDEPGRYGGRKRGGSARAAVVAGEGRIVKSKGRLFPSGGPTWAFFMKKEARQQDAAGPETGEIMPGTGRGVVPFHGRRTQVPGGWDHLWNFGMPEL